jgi:hypothetical protein
MFELSKENLLNYRLFVKKSKEEKSKWDIWLFDLLVFYYYYENKAYDNKTMSTTELKLWFFKIIFSAQEHRMKESLI